MKASILRAINESVAQSKKLRAGLASVNDWVGGFRYGSYTLEDEAALAASFCDLDPTSRRGGGSGGCWR